ncbi:MAG: DUF424 family protein [Candidatus Methanofastidiosa archaeon]|nr:DUF424 family protein [Candidatus Methanofastidiosa archaeon]
MRAYVKVHKACADVIVAICDEDELGKSYAEGTLRLSVNTGFYKGTLVDIADLDTYFVASTILNLVGRHCVDKAIAAGVISPKNVLRIGDTVHAQMVVV